MIGKILLLGPQNTIDDPTNTGGTMVLFEQLLKEFDDLKIEYKVIDTNAQNYKNFYYTWISVIYQFFKNFKDFEHISIHGTINHYITLAPVVIFVAKLFGKSVSLRKFAGNFDEVYKNSNTIVKKDIEYVLKNADINFFETKHLVSFFQRFNKNTFWFPNVREHTKDKNKKREFNKRFVFMSHVWKSKGVDEILEASKELDSSYTIDLYGYMNKKEYDEEYFNKYSNVSYKGALPPDKVMQTLEKYDVLLLPTFYEGEGYPGIIIEAYSIGIPCITTRHKAIPEIVENNKSGILIEPKDTKALVEAIKSFDKQNYISFSKEAKQAFKQFDSKIQTEKFLISLSDICYKGGKSYNRFIKKSKSISDSDM